MSVNGLHRKLEGALLGYLESLGSTPGTVNLYRAFDVSAGQTRVAFPAVTVRCGESRPMSPDLDATSGATNRYGSVDIVVHTWLADPREGGVSVQPAIDQHDAISGWVADALHSASLVADINAAAAGVVVEQVDLPRIVGPDVEEGAIVSRIAFDVLCYGTEG